MVSLMLLMVLMAATVLSVNYYAATQQQIARNRKGAAEQDFKRQAVLQESLWQVLSDPCYRTPVQGEAVTFEGTGFTRKIVNSSLGGHEDAVLIQVMEQGSAARLSRGYRYFCNAVTGEVQSSIRTGFTKPERMGLDASGNLFIADALNHRIVRRDTAGTMTVLAGTGNAGFDGDGGLADSSRLNYPSGVCADASGNVYIADSDNHRIRMVTPAGIILTVAGNDSGGGHSGDGGPAVDAQVSKPRDVAFHEASGSLYIADTENSCIRKINSSGIISTVAGQPGQTGYTGDGGQAASARLNKPYGLDVTASGVVYIADTDNFVIRRIDTAGVITTVAGSNKDGSTGDGGPATSARLSQVRDVAADTAGNLYLTDTGNHRIRRVCASDGIIETLTGSIPGTRDNVIATEARMNQPMGIALAPSLSGKIIYISDTQNNSLRMLTFKIEPGF